MCASHWLVYKCKVAWYDQNIIWRWEGLFTFFFCFTFNRKGEQERIYWESFCRSISVHSVQSLSGFFLKCSMWNRLFSDTQYWFEGYRMEKCPPVVSVLMICVSIHCHQWECGTNVSIHYHHWECETQMCRSIGWCVNDCVSYKLVT